MARRSQLEKKYLTKTVRLRGTDYVFRELSGSQYEEFVKMAEGPDGTADLSAVLKLMAPEALSSPTLTAEEIYDLPMPVFNTIIKIVNDMHFRNEPEETLTEEGKADLGNGSERETD